MYFVIIINRFSTYGGIRIILNFTNKIISYKILSLQGFCSQATILSMDCLVLFLCHHNIDIFLVVLPLLYIISLPFSWFPSCACVLNHSLEQRWACLDFLIRSGSGFKKPASSGSGQTRFFISQKNHFRYSKIRF